MEHSAGQVRYFELFSSLHISQVRIGDGPKGLALSIQFSPQPKMTPFAASLAPLFIALLATNPSLRSDSVYQIIRTKHTPSIRQSESRQQLGGSGRGQVISKRGSCRTFWLKLLGKYGVISAALSSSMAGQMVGRLERKVVKDLCGLTRDRTRSLTYLSGTHFEASSG
jgi:hypothetical protein